MINYIIYRYYYNKQTQQTQWERPIELGPAPVGTGWFGRGQAGSNAAQIYALSNQKFLSRPAKKQKDFIDPKKYYTEGSNEYNIWYGTYYGDTKDKDKDPASDRCKLEEDAGYTKADFGDEKRKDRKFFCLHFARGMCAKGNDCPYYHRIPLPEDDAKCDELYDCFGRQRHNKHKDDMNGVGSFMKPSRTLFVGNLLKHKYDTPKLLEDAIWKHFQEWGELESCNVIHRLAIAFPRYRLRTSAEFAKEAMSQQALDGGEILSIRWAHDDPNPIAKDSIDRSDRDALVALMKAKGINIDQAPFEYPAEYQVPAAKRLKLEDGVDISEIAYPNTDNQYQYNNSTDQTNTTDNLSEEYLEYYKKYYPDYYAQLTQTNSNVEEKKDNSEDKDDDKDKNDDNNNNNNDEEDDDDDDDDDGKWTEIVDEKTGATYYYHTGTGESRWTKPTNEQ